MKKTAITLSLAAVVLLSGCATNQIPVATFPEVPPMLLEKCPNLEQLSQDAKLSDVAKTVNNNYKLYHLCSTQNEAWIEWYKLNKIIYDGIEPLEKE